jgi:hypothetical protein
MKKDYDWSELFPLNLKDSKLKQIEWDKFYDEKFSKKQIILHHTVSGPGIRGDLRTWLQYRSHIATCIIIDRDGTINQLFPSKYWAKHLGVKGKQTLDKHSIAVELDNWGQLTKKGDDFYTIYGNKVNVPITHYPDKFRGEEYFESYTHSQLKSLGELILLWNKRYNIPLNYNEDMWDLSENALEGKPGIWAHVSFREYPSKHNKWDVHPQPELIEMLKSLNKDENS